jgi:rhodanese-related sulfurtransferase
MKIELILTGKRLAAAVAIFLGIVLAMASSIARGTGAGPADAAAIAQTIVTEKDHVTPTELAHWIIEKRQDYQLVDIRQPWQFDDYHIPTAVNIPLPQLFQDAGLSQLSRTKKIIVYGLGAGHSAETQLLLSLKGYDALSLKEGLSAWWDQVMTPLSILSDTSSPAGYRQAKQLRENFMGTAPTGSTQAGAPTVLPEVPTPGNVPEGKQPSSGPKLKLGRGCS